MITPASHFQTDKVIGGSTTETKQIAVQSIPKTNGSAWSSYSTTVGFEGSWVIYVTEGGSNDWCRAAAVYE